MNNINNKLSSFHFVKCRVLTEIDENGETIQEAVIKIIKDGKEIYTAAESDSMLKAVYEALKKALVVFHPELRNTHLVEYRELYSGNNVEVTIISRDNSFSKWTIKTKAPDDINARIMAVAASLNYKIECI